MPKQFQMNGISTSDNRCGNCKRKLIVEGGREFCFYCNTIAKEDQKIIEEHSQLLRNKEVNQMMDAFKEKSLMNRDLENARLSGYKPHNESQLTALRKAKAYIKEFDGEKGLIFQGRPGLGKSHLAASIVKKIVRKKHTGIFISLPRLMTELKATYNSKSAIRETDILTALQKVSLLVIDDLGVEMGGKEDSSAWAKSKIYEVIDSRIGLATIYTTNFSGKELLHMYGERDFSRMVQYCESIVIEGDNYRMQKFKQGGSKNE